MADPEGGDVSRQAFQVAYDGAHGDDAHSMDVEQLAPALLSFGRLIREANAELNGKKAKANVLVTSDFEHKCFNINFEVIQHIIHQLATLLQSEEVKTARQILVDLGFIGGGGGLGLIGYLKWKRGREVDEIRDSDQKGVVIVQIGSGNTATVNQNAIRLSQSPKIRKAMEGALAPLGTNGVKTISFHEKDKEVAVYDETDAKEIVASFDIPELTETAAAKEELPDTVTAWLRVYGPVYDVKVQSWRFLYGDHPIYADISETTIAEDAITRGGALVNDLYKVKMEVTQHLTEGGQIRLEHKIIDVIDFRPSPQQPSLPLGD
jgi:hypothetical protein